MKNSELDKMYLRDLERRAAAMAICMIAIRDFLDAGLQAAGTNPVTEFPTTEIQSMVETLNVGIYQSRGKKPD